MNKDQIIWQLNDISHQLNMMSDDEFNAGFLSKECFEKKFDYFCFQKNVKITTKIIMNEVKVN